MKRLTCGLILVLGMAPAAPKAEEIRSLDETARRPASGAEIETTRPDALERVERSRLLRVGMAANPPWVFKRIDGSLAGYSVDLVRRLSEDMGWTLELVETDWENLLVGLRTDRYDLVASGLSITPQRARQVSFSRSYGQHALVLVEPRRSPGWTWGENERPRYGVLGGGFNERQAREMLADSAEIEAFATIEAALGQVLDGELDGLVTEQPMAVAMAALFPDAVEINRDVALGGSEHAFAVARGEQAFIELLDAWISYRQAGGWLPRQARYWLESPHWLTLIVADPLPGLDAGED